MNARFVRCAAVVLALASPACFGSDRADAFANMPSDTIPLVMGDGDILITNPDSSMQLGMVRDTVLMQFGEKTRRQLRRDLDTANIESQNGIGAAIERAVKRKVGAMLGRRLVVPLSAIDSVYLDGDRIVFDYRDRRGFNFDSMKNDDRPVLASFRPADARRFVEAVQARKAQRSGRN